MSVLKNKIEEHDGKLYIKCHVELIPVVEESESAIPIWREDNLLSKTPHNTDSTPYHLIFMNYNNSYNKGDYIVDNHEVFEGIGKVIPADVDYDPGKGTPYYPLVLASTNTDLELPTPSHQFIDKYIEMYNQEVRIQEVLIEVNECDLKSSEFVYVVKTDKYFTITTRKVKDTYIQAEVNKLIEDNMQLRRELLEARNKIALLQKFTIPTFGTSEFNEMCGKIFGGNSN